MTGFAWEPLDRALDDGLAECVRRHWEEVGRHKDKMPLAVDWPKYRRLERERILYLMGARDEGKLVGYASWLVMPHLHYAETIHAISDAIWVDESRRGLGVRLIQACEEALAAVASPGWCRIVFHVKEDIYAERGTVGALLERRGYDRFERQYDKMVRA